MIASYTSLYFLSPTHYLQGINAHDVKKMIVLSKDHRDSIARLFDCCKRGEFLDACDLIIRCNELFHTIISYEQLTNYSSPDCVQRDRQVFIRCQRHIEHLTLSQHPDHFRSLNELERFANFLSYVLTDPHEDCAITALEQSFLAEYRQLPIADLTERVDACSKMVLIRLLLEEGRTCDCFEAFASLSSLEEKLPHVKKLWIDFLYLEDNYYYCFNVIEEYLSHFPDDMSVWMRVVLLYVKFERWDLVQYYAEQCESIDEEYSSHFRSLKRRAIQYYTCNLAQAMQGCDQSFI